MSNIDSLFSSPGTVREVSIDFETRSAMDLKACGAHRYARHPSTDVMIAVFRFSQWESYRWHPGEQLPERVLAAIHDESVTWHAWNAAFEIVIWKHQMAGKYGFPELPIERWSCTMVRALMTGLPGQLEKAAPAMGLPEEFWKDDEGSKVMKRVSKPRKKVALGEEPASWHKEPGFQDTLTCYDSMGQLWLGRDPWKAAVSACGEFTIYCDPDTGEEWVARWWNDTERLTTLYDYCDQDTLAEWMIGEQIAPMIPVELEAWHMDQRINHRGYRIDTDFVRVAQQVSDEALVVANEEALALSHGHVTSLTKPVEVRDWMNARLQELGWAPIGGIGKEVLIVLRAQLQNELDNGTFRKETIGSIIRMIDLRLNEAKTSTKKLNSMLNAADTDDQRVRGGLQFAGAGRTARWAGRLVQPHNFPRPEKWASGGAAVEQLIDIIRNDETVWMRLTYGGIGVVISSMLRPCIAAAEGNVLTAADFNAIEMRFSAWLTDCEMILGALNRNEDVYRIMAAKVFGYADWRHIDKDSFERMLGKKIILGCFEANTPVLTGRGWVPIVNVRSTDTIWDGEGWQLCDGAVYQGKKTTVEYAGVRATPDHKTLVGRDWVPWSRVRDGSTQYQKLAHITASLPSSMSVLGREAGYQGCTSSAAARTPGIRSTIRTSYTDGRRGAMTARSGHPASRERKGSALRTLCQKTITARGGSIGGMPSTPDVTGQDPNRTRGTGGAASAWTRSGTTSGSFWRTYAALTDGMTRCWSWIEKTMTATTPWATCACPLGQSSWLTPAAPSASSTRAGNTATRLLPGSAALASQRLRYLAGSMREKARSSASPTSTSHEAHVYDVLNAGPRNRFTIMTENGPLIVHNCGYQMGVDKFLKSCRDEGLTIDRSLADNAVKTYRSENHEIKAAWQQLENAAVRAVQSGQRVQALKGKVAFYMNGQNLHCVLPSGRELVYLRAYIKPEMKFGREVATVCFYGWNSEFHRMEWQSMYGGRWLENITQAGSRDVLRDAIMRLDRAGYSLTMSIHDEVVCEDLVGSYSVKDMESVMELIPEWAPGLPLKVEGWQGQRYRK